MSEDKWISVSDRLPEEYEPVDVWSTEYGRLPNYKLEILSYDNKFFDPLETGPCTVRDVTHWRPLPAPPKTTPAE